MYTIDSEEEEVSEVAVRVIELVVSTIVVFVMIVIVAYNT